VAWYRAGLNVPLQMPKLATYLGHSSVACTYWYIEAVPELLQLATEFERTIRKGAHFGEIGHAFRKIFGQPFRARFGQFPERSDA